MNLDLMEEERQSYSIMHNAWFGSIHARSTTDHGTKSIMHKTSYQRLCLAMTSLVFTALQEAQVPLSAALVASWRDQGHDLDAFLALCQDAIHGPDVMTTMLLPGWLTFDHPHHLLYGAPWL